MAAKPPPSIGGEEETPWSTIAEEFPMPKTRREVITAFERILNLGQVEKVVCIAGKPFKVYRRVQRAPEDLDIPEEMIDADLMNATRNAVMEPFHVDSSDSDKALHAATGQLFYAVSNLYGRGLVPRALILKNTDALAEWLGLKFDQRSLFGIDLVFHSDVPRDAALLVASKSASPEDIECSLRLELNIKPENPDAPDPTPTAHEEDS